jgi:four helix bundle protein
VLGTLEPREDIKVSTEIRSYRDLIVWQKSMVMTATCYKLVESFPKDEKYRLTDQLLRAAISVPSNIAEGHTRGTRKDYAHFISIARASLAELETHLILAQTVGLKSPDTMDTILAQAEEVGRMLTALLNRLRSPST